MLARSGAAWVNGCESRAVVLTCWHIVHHAVVLKAHAWHLTGRFWMRSGRQCASARMSLWAGHWPSRLCPVAPRQASHGRVVLIHTILSHLNKHRQLVPQVPHPLQDVMLAFSNASSLECAPGHHSRAAETPTWQLLVLPLDVPAAAAAAATCGHQQVPQEWREVNAATCRLLIHPLMNPSLDKSLRTSISACTPGHACGRRGVTLCVCRAA